MCGVVLEQRLPTRGVAELWQLNSKLLDYGGSPSKLMMGSSMLVIKVNTLWQRITTWNP